MLIPYFASLRRENSLLITIKLKHIQLTRIPSRTLPDMAFPVPLAVTQATGYRQRMSQEDSKLLLLSLGCRERLPQRSQVTRPVVCLATSIRLCKACRWQMQACQAWQLLSFRRLQVCTALRLRSNLRMASQALATNSLIPLIWNKVRTCQGSEMDFQCSKCHLSLDRSGRSFSPQDRCMAWEGPRRLDLLLAFEQFKCTDFSA